MHQLQGSESERARERSTQVDGFSFEVKPLTSVLIAEISKQQSAITFNYTMAFGANAKKKRLLKFRIPC